MLAIGELLCCRLMTRMSMARQLAAFTAISVFLVIFGLPGSGEDIVLIGQENWSLGKSTLHIVDVDAQTAKVWLVISEPSGSMLSEIMSLNDTLFWKSQSLNIVGIYAGSLADLVRLRINSSD